MEKEEERTTEPMTRSASRTSAAESTALSAESDADLRVPYFCEENVWRLAYRKLAQQQQQQKEQQQEEQQTQYEYLAAFVSNPDKAVPMFFQRAAAAADDEDVRRNCSYVCWDYHVILLRMRRRRRRRRRGQQLRIGDAKSRDSDHAGEDADDDDEEVEEIDVLDIDTLLPYPCPLQEYLERSFPHCFYGNNGDDDADDTRRHWPQFRVVPARSYLRHFSSDRMHMFDREKGRWRVQELPPYPCILTAGGESNLMSGYLDFSSSAPSSPTTGSANDDDNKLADTNSLKDGENVDSSTGKDGGDGHGAGGCYYGTILTIDELQDRALLLASLRKHDKRREKEQNRT